MKKLKLIVLLSFIIFTFTGCFSKTELEDYAYVIAIGIDKGPKNNYIISFQIAVPIKIAGEGSNGSGKESTSLVTLETDTIYNSISRANAMISKEITLSHNKIIVFSEEVAKEGIQELLNAFVTNREIRPKTSMLVYKGLAKDLLASLEPILEKNPSRYYDLLLDSNQYTGYAIDNTLFHFYLASQDTLSSPYALLTEPVREEEASIDVPAKSQNNQQKNELPSGDFKNKQAKDEVPSVELQSEQAKNKAPSGDSQSEQAQNKDSSGDSPDKQAQGNKFSGDSQSNQDSSETVSENSQNDQLKSSNTSSDSEPLPSTANVAGIAIFTNDRLVGEIKDEQMLSHILLLGKLKKVNIDIEDIEDKTKTTVIKLRQVEEPKIDVKIEENIPKIDILIRLECDLITSGSQIDYTKEENKEKLSDAIKEKLTKDMKQYLTKIAKEFKADPIGFGKYYRKKVLTLKELENIEWKEIFPNSEFKTEFQIHLNTTQMVSNQISK